MKNADGSRPRSREDPLVGGSEASLGSAIDSDSVLGRGRSSSLRYDQKPDNKTYVHRQSRSRPRKSHQNGHLFHIFNSLKPFGKRDDHMRTSSSSECSLLSHRKLSSTSQSANSDAESPSQLRNVSIRLANSSPSTSPGTSTGHDPVILPTFTVSQDPHSLNSPTEELKSSGASYISNVSHTSHASHASHASHTSHASLSSHNSGNTQPSPQTLSRRSSMDSEPDRGRSLLAKGRQGVGRSASPYIRRLKLFPSFQTAAAVPERFLGRRSASTSQFEEISSDGELSPTQVSAFDHPPMPFEKPVKLDSALQNNRQSLQPAYLQNHRSFLRHVDLPNAPIFYEKTSFLRVYRFDGTFGTIACSVDITTSDLIQLAARKFFIDDALECRLVILFPSRVRVLPPESQPAVLVRNMLIRAGYHSETDNLSDVIRDDTSFLGRIVLVSGSESLRPPALHQQGKRELVLTNTDVTDGPGLVCSDNMAVDTIDVSGSAFNHTEMSFPNLKRLRLSQFFPPSVTISNHILEGIGGMLANLTFLDLSCNGLASLSGLDLTLAPLLRYIDLRGNQLSELPESLMHLPFLQVLECGTNQLKSFNMWNPSLHRIGLSYNMLSQLDLTFEQAMQMQKLTTLQMCANFINEMPESLHLLPILRELDLRHNVLDNPVSSLTPTLTKLVCSYNNPRKFGHRDSSTEGRDSIGVESIALPNLLELRVDNMPNLDFYEHFSMAHITVLDMSTTNLPFVNEALFTHAPNLRVLNLSENNLTVLPDTILNLRLLEHLDISQNSLVELPKNLWILPKLRVLDVHANNIKTVSASLFHSQRLHTLNLSSNLLSTFTEGVDSVDSVSPISKLILCDNQLNEEAFELSFKLPHLKCLDLSYNFLTELPSTLFQHLPELEELYLSGNRLSTLPHDCFAQAQNLHILRVNANRLHTLPGELSKATRLEVLDAGANQLRYNVANYPFDWNWRWNKELRYLNFSANRRLEIRKAPQLLDGKVVDLADFCVLPKLVTLGLMDVTLTTNAVPYGTSDCRVRTFGSDHTQFRVGIADSLGFRPLANNDLVVERFRDSDNESLIALFDGQNEVPNEGNKISNIAQEIFPSILKRELSVQDNPVNALRRAFLETHREIGNNTLLSPEEIAHTSLGHRFARAPRLNSSDWSSGTGATVLYFTGKKLYIATVGGARVVLSRANGTHSVLSKPLPPVAEELERIRASGGSVDPNTSYVNGISQFPRLIGCYTAGTVFSAAPWIYEYDITNMFEGSDQVIIASSTLWNVMGHETAADIARSCSHDSVLAAMKLRDFSQAYGCTDRVMALVIGRQTPLDEVDTKRRQVSDGDIHDTDSIQAMALRKHMEHLLTEDSTLARLGTEVSPPFGDVTMVFTDIRNSTYLWETYPPVMRAAIRTHNSLMRRSIRLMDGYEVKNEGDAFIISFHTPIKALIWCLTVQQHLLTAEWPQELLEVGECSPVKDESGNVIFRGLSVRMGIHCGRPVAEPDPVTRRMDYFGPMVNRASRISGVARGGQISVSADFLNVLNRTMEAHSRVLSGEMQITDAYPWVAPQIAEALDRSATLLEHSKYTVREYGELKLRGIENLEHIYNIYPQQLASREKWYIEEDKKEKELEMKRKEEELEKEQHRSSRKQHFLHPLHHHSLPRIGESDLSTYESSIRHDSINSPTMPNIEPRRQSEVSLNSITSSGSGDLLRDQLLRELALRKQVVDEQMQDSVSAIPDLFDPFQSLAHRLEALCVASIGGASLKSMQQTLQVLEPPVLTTSDMATQARQIWITRIENAVKRLEEITSSPK